jgi:Cu(I)/Ag(I) efflux system membrane fusion protein
MFVNAIIRVPLVTGIVVPVTAVIDTGKRQVVWVETSPGMFEPRDVQVGERVEDKAQILSGLKPGDMVAVSGGYLLDSESQLKGSGGGHENMPGMKKDENGGKTPTLPAQPKKKDDLKMDDMKM